MTLKRMEKLLARVEGLLTESAAPSEPRALSPTELLAQRWRERLASNTMGRGSEAAADARRREEEQTVKDALELMQSSRYRNVPVVDDDRRLVGVVRQVDIIKFLAESFPEELLNLPPRPHQKLKEPEGA